MLSTETVKKAVGIIDFPFKFNRVNKIKHYLKLFLNNVFMPKPENHFKKSNLFLKISLYNLTVHLYSTV